MENKKKIFEGKKEFEIQDFKVLDSTDGKVRIGGYANTKGHADRYGDIPTVLASERNFIYEIGDYKKNPVLLIDHVNRVDHLAGSIDVIREDEKGLYFEATFSESNAQPVAHARTVYAEGHAKAISIAGRFHYENVKAPEQLTLAEIFEISLVAVPADPDSLVAPIVTATAETEEIEEALSAASADVKATLENLEVKKVVKEVQKTKALLTGKAR